MADAQKWLTETAFVVPGTKAKVPRWAMVALVGGLIVLLLLSKRGAGLFSEPGEEQEEEEILGGVFEELPDLPGLPELPSVVSELQRRTNGKTPEPTYTGPSQSSPEAAAMKSRYFDTWGVRKEPVRSAIYQPVRLEGVMVGEVGPLPPVSPTVPGGTLGGRDIRTITYTPYTAPTPTTYPKVKAI